MKKIVINFKRNSVTTVGRVNERDINLAIARLRSRQTHPSLRDQAKKAIRCAWKALVLTIKRKPTTPRYIEVEMPVALEYYQHQQDQCRAVQK